MVGSGSRERTEEIGEEQIACADNDRTCDDAATISSAYDACCRPYIAA